MKRLFINIFCLFLCSNIFAQSAEDILKKTESVFQKDGGITASFQILIQNKNNPAEKSDGTLKMRGNNFTIETPDIKVWFDGKNQWTQLSNSNEVNLTAPTDNELDAMNPSVLFNLYKNGYKASKESDAKIQGKDYYQIRLIPAKTKSSIKSIRVLVGKDNYRIKQILMESANTTKNTITINKYLPNQTFTDNDFKFNTKQYPDLEIIDLR